MKEVKEGLADYELAVMLRDKGCSLGNLWYNSEGELSGHQYYDISEDADVMCCTLSLAQTWLRVIHDVHVTPVLYQRWIEGYGNFTDGYGWEWCYNKNRGASVSFVGPFEQALAEGIKEGIKLIE